ncbi:MAG: glycosyltransferase [Rhodocyclaceae bacterium]|nr:glycosyltransferase [Rhodocyclaceae bacterium]
MKIAFFVAEFPVLSETFVIRQVAGMVRAGHDITVIAGQRGEAGLGNSLFSELGLAERVVAIRQSGRVRQLRAVLRLLLSAASSWAGVRSLEVAIRAALAGSAGSLIDIASLAGRPALGRFDAVIAHFGPAGVRAMHLQQCGMLDGPLATVFHGFDVSDRRTVARCRRQYRALFAHCAALLPISELWRSRLIGWGACESRVRVLHMGVDVDRIPMLDAERPVARPLRVLSVARLTEKKGLAYGIEAVRRSPGPIHYRIIGSGPDEAALRAAAADLPEGKVVEFLGRRPHDEVFAALAESDVFLLPSVTAAGGDMEGIPVALMEAMALGVLVIASRHSGIPELVVDGASGFLAGERNAEEIAEALARCARPDAASSIARMRRAARAAVEAGFDNAALDRELEGVCRMLAANGAIETDSGPAALDAARTS